MHLRIIRTLLLLAMSLAGLPRPTAAQETPLVAFLVRHAEKVAEPTGDPPLTGQGQRRAAALADLLADAGIVAVWSTDYARTRDTAAPIAERLGLVPSLYDPGDLPGFANALRAAGGRVLVVGHSNTTPQLIALLGGDPGTPIDDATEYDRLYIVVQAPGGPVTTLLRYGEPHPKG